MPANATVPASYIGFIQEETRVHHSGPRRGSGRPGRRQRSRTTNNERNGFLAGKNLQRSIMDAFDKHGTRSEREKIHGMVTCNRHQNWIECPEHHEGRLHHTTFCGQRLCPICQKRRSLLAKKKYKPAMVQAVSGAYTPELGLLVPLFVTLTWPSVEHMDQSHVSGMWGDLRNLNRQKWWKSRVVGEVWALEWTFSIAFGHHSHAHGIIMVPRTLYDGCVRAFKLAHADLPKMERKEYREWAARWWADNGPLPKPMLSSAWEGLTGAKVVNVRMLKGRVKEWGSETGLEAALTEVLKYPIKETDYLRDRELRKEEIEEIDARAGEILDRDEALVELYRAIRGRRLSDVRGCLRGQLLAAMKEVEEAKTNELLHTDLDDMIKQKTQCTKCGGHYVEREYHLVHGRYVLVNEQPLGTTFPGYDPQARRLLQMGLDRATIAKVRPVLGRAYRTFLGRQSEILRSRPDDLRLAKTVTEFKAEVRAANFGD